jgi:hypothetical protein
MRYHRVGDVGIYRQCKLCSKCGQPMKPSGVKKRPNEYDHAQGCPYSRKQTG